MSTSDKRSVVENRSAARFIENIFMNLYKFGTNYLIVLPTLIKLVN